MSDDPARPTQFAESPGAAVGGANHDREKYAVLSYQTDNLGDEIQSVAAEQFLPGIDLRIDRDRLDRRPDGCKIILHGWYINAPQCWPPGSFLSPLITSIHISRELFPQNLGGLKPTDILLRGESLRYLRDHGPIGARDLSTLALLRDHHIDAQFSACLTLTLGSGRVAVHGDYVCAVDLPPALPSADPEYASHPN